jgi:hypothetical protein
VAPADPLIVFIGYKDRVVKLTYANFPNGSVIMIVDKTSGAVVPHSVMRISHESGKLEIRFPPEAPPGAYCIRGIDRADKKIAETVEFYVAA